MEPKDVEDIITRGLEGATCTATDLTGTMDHWGLDVKWSGFEGLTLMEQHKAVLETVRPYMADGDNTIHAVQIKTSC